MTQNAFRLRLVWKDARLMTSLAIATLCGILIVNFGILISAFLLGENRDHGVGVSFAFWFLFPNLFAIGAPPMLVGNEEECKTLDWLRTLPVRWTSVLHSKLLVAILALATVWLISSLVFGLQMVLSTGSPRRSLFLDDHSGYFALVAYPLFSIFLLLIGFLTSFLFRSPVTGLIAIFPAMMGVFFVGTKNIQWLWSLNRPGAWNHTGSSVGDHDAFFLVIMVSAFYFALTTAGVYWFARRRMQSFHPSLPRGLRDKRQPLLVEDSFRPPAFVSLQRPPVYWALTWQQLRHLGGPFMGCVCLLWITLLLDSDHGPLRQPVFEWFSVWPIWMAMPMVGIAMGCSTFYHDVSRRQCDFFTDRGVSPTRVWWVRVIVSLALLLIAWVPVGLVAVQIGLYQLPDSSFWTMAILLGVTWPVSVLISMSVRRPALSFFSSAITITMAWVVSGSLFVVYPGYIFSIAFCAPVLLFASWRLCRMWMDGHLDRGFYLRLVGYFGLALAVPYVITFSHRFASTPKIQTEWRQKISTTATPVGSIVGTSDGRTPASELAHFLVVRRQAGNQQHYWKPTSQITPTELKEKLTQEISESDSLGKHLGIQQLDQLIWHGAHSGGLLVDWKADPSMESYKDLEPLLIELLLLWAKRSRQMIVDGDGSVADLLHIASWAERHAVTLLESNRDGTEQWKRLSRLIPEEALREQSRRMAIIGEWKSFLTRTWIDKENSRIGKELACQPLLQGASGWLGIERHRSEAYVEQFIRLTLQELDQKTYFADPEIRSNAAEAWYSAVLGPLIHDQLSDENIHHPGEFSLLHWAMALDAHEHRIKTLQANGPRGALP